MRNNAPETIEELLATLPETYTLAERELIQRAYKIAEQAHAGQKRASGEPYITHCVAVAGILAQYHMPAEVLIAGLLHDTLEDTDLSADVIRNEFGETVVNLVQGVTKLTQLPRVSRGERADENGSENSETPSISEEELRNRKRELAIETLRKTFLAMDNDVRVVLIKLADRLHNMRTLEAFPPAKQKRIAQETLDIFAPLANRLGIWQMKWELEDLGFRYTNPEKYFEIAYQLNSQRQAREQEIQRIIERMRKVLEEGGIKAEITGRPKHIYSIYRKMITKNRPFEMVRDIRAVRLIVPDVASCYAALGIVHTHWRPIPGEFDDYIAAPKENFYQSLHTAVIYDDGKPLEVQIRTPEMHENAEYGIAAHWRYKEGKAKHDQFDERIKWLRRLMEWRQDVSDAHEFVENMKTDVFKDRVYVFTPRGDVIDLPAGSTPIDFAYHVHTSIGHRCRGAKVNGKLVPLDYELKTGDQVMILTAKQGGPSRDWLNPNLGLVRTASARSKIRAWFRKQDREQNLAQGKAILEKELERLNLAPLDQQSLQTLASKFDRTPDELFIAIGCGDLTIGRVLNKLIEATKSSTTDDDIATVPPTADENISGSVTILGVKDLYTTMARCCNPTPGDSIIGYITRGRGVTIHREDCPNIIRIRERERLIKVSWGENVRTYPVPIRIKAYDRQGLMSDITSLLNNENVNIVSVNVRVNKSLAEIRLVVEVKDIAQLSRILVRLENLPNVLEAIRLKGG